VSERAGGGGAEPPEDRLGDLGSGRSAADRLAELDVTQPEEEEGRARPAGPPPRPSGVYTWLIGVAFLAVVALAAISTLPDAGEGLRGPSVGDELPDFAAPLATGSSDRDVNLAGSGDENPACQVREPDALNICTLREERPVVLTYITTRGADCEPALDVVERVRSEFPQIGFVGVVGGQERDDVAELVRRREWRFPVVVDRHGDLANVYGYGVCPTTTFAYRGGEVRANELGNLGQDRLRAEVRELLRRP
jgi:hypothetical protein